jgi:hypothetical protein
MQPDDGCPPILDTLTEAELERLRRLIAWIAPNATTAEIDWARLVSAIRDRSPPVPVSDLPSDIKEKYWEWLAQVSGGREYELTLKMPLEAAAAQFEREKAEVDRLVSSGRCTHEQAWDKVKAEQDARLAGDGSLDPAKIDAFLDEDASDEAELPRVEAGPVTDP